MLFFKLSYRKHYYREKFIKEKNSNISKKVYLLVFFLNMLKKEKKFT